MSCARDTGACCWAGCASCMAICAGCAIAGGCVCWVMTTCDVDAIGYISTGMVSPWIAACSMCSRTGWVGDSCACGSSSVATW